MKVLLFLVFLFLMVGVVSADTAIIYAENNAVVKNTTDTQTWSAIILGVGTSSSTGSSSNYIYASATTNRWREVQRTGSTFNLTPYAGGTITGVNLSLWGRSKFNYLGGTINGVITDASPTTPTAWQTSDYNKNETTLLGTYTYDAWTTAQYNNLSLTSSYFQGKIGSYATIMFRSSNDYYSSTPTYTTSRDFGMGTYTIEQAGTSNDPFLEVTYTPAAAPVASFTCTKSFLRIPTQITCTDTSTNAPSTWSWNMGDGTAALTTQNVTYTYYKRGTWGITLNASSPDGYNTTPTATNVRVVGYENNW